MKSVQLRCLLGVVLFVAGSFSNVNAQVTDTTKKDTTEKILTLPDTVPHLQSKTLSYVVPAVFASYGALSFGIKTIRNVDYHVHNDMEEDHPNFHTKIDDYLRYVPIAAVYGLNLGKVNGKNSFIDRTILLAMSEAIFGGSTAVLKRVTHRERPNGQDNHSFPSGHSGTAFVSAEFMAQEYSDRSPWYGVFAYSVATSTAVLRVYNDKHWFSDIVAGMGVGILSTKAAYFVYPLFRNKIFHDKKDKKGNKSSLVLPTYQNGTPGLMFVKTF